MKKIAFLLLLIINSFSAFADAYLYIDDVSIKPGETKDLSVKLKNDVDITAFQCDLYLPTGISVVQTFDSNINKNTNDIALTDRKQSTHSLSSNVQSDGAMRIVAFSSKNEAFSGNDGALFTIKIKADDNIAIGKYTIRLANVELTTFSGWSTIPATMPAHDVTITGSFAANSYNLIYMVDGTEYKRTSLSYGSAITPEPAPTKEGYAFSGWSTIPATMPAHDVTITGSFAANSYNLIYMVDGTEYKRTSLACGSAITPEPAPTKEGYAFSGWSTIPATMPAHDVTITGSFAANSYNLIYMVDGTEYKRTSLAYGSAITPEPAPTKEGYAFSGWSTIPATMPAHDVTITGSFAANSYNLIYMVDGTEYKRTSLAYGSAITPEPAPTKEGYAFSGWSTIPATMPAHDVTITGSFAANSYNLIYMVDGTEYKRTSLSYGSAITPEPAPTKEGYAFSGWSTIPATMPAHDVTITGSFAANSYNLIYMVDGTEYKRTSLSYGSAITPEPAPTKEGYAFSGWSTIPATMPAHDVTITGSFAANSYNLIYMVDGTEYKRTSLAYGSAITPEPAPTKEGYAFSGWSTIPATMPAHDVTITGTFNVNYYTITYKVDGIIYKTVSVAYGSILTPEPAPTKEGYVFSGWSTIPETMPANDIEVTGSFIVSGIKEISSNSFVNVYNLEGKRIKSHIDVNALKEILPTGVYIVNGKKYCIIHD
jgi:hypothetical protein